MREELLKGLTKEQIAKVKACNSQEEILNLAKEEGVELNDEQLAAVKKKQRVVWNRQHAMPWMFK